MAVIKKSYKIIFETDTLERNLAETFKGYIADNLSGGVGDQVMKMLELCDRFNSGLYKHNYPKEITKVTLAYYKRSGKAEATVQYGDWRGRRYGDGKISGLLFGGTAIYAVKENIEYISIHDKVMYEQINGYQIVFTLQPLK